MVILKYDAFQKYKVFESNIYDQDDENNQLREETKKDVSRCISLILAQYPFFGEYLIECRFLYDAPGVDTMATDGKNIFISSRFAASLSDAQMIFILCHEVLHIMLLHHLRMHNKFGANAHEHARGWNVAADHEINPMLVKEGLLTADEVKNAIKGLYDEKYIGKSAETIYNELGDDEKGQDSPNSEYPVNVGYPIETKDGKFGKITKINVNGTYEYEEITKEEAYSLAESIFGGN